MKNFILIAFVFMSGYSFAQTTPVSTESMSATERAQRIETINKELVKLEKKVTKAEKIAASKIQENSDAKIKLDYNAKQQQETVENIARVKSEMNGYDLSALQDKIKRLTIEKRKLESSNKRDANSIIKKKALIEKLYAEIEQMENSIASNELAIEETQDNIKDTEDIITTNGLVDKDAELTSLEKTMASLKKEDKKLTSKIEKNKNTIKTKNAEKSVAESKVTKLKTDKSLLNQKSGSQTTPGVH